MSFIHSESAKPIEAYKSKSSKDEFLENLREEFDLAFSADALFALANYDAIVRADVEKLITQSFLYMHDVELLGEAQKEGIDTQGLLNKQAQHHTEFIEILRTLYQHAREHGKDIPYNIDNLSRAKSAQIALFVAYEHKENESKSSGSFMKSA